MTNDALKALDDIECCFNADEWPYQDYQDIMKNIKTLRAALAPVDVEGKIKSILSVVQYDSRDAVEKDLRMFLAPVDVESALDFLDKMISAPYATYTSISRKQLKKLRQVIASQGLVGVPEWNDDMDAAPKGKTIFVWTGNAEFPCRHEASWREPTESEYWVSGSEYPDPKEQTFGPEAGWFCDDGLSFKLDEENFPTHWMPLPAAPKKDGV